MTFETDLQEQAAAAEEATDPELEATEAPASIGDIPTTSYGGVVAWVCPTCGYMSREDADAIVTHHAKAHGSAAAEPKAEASPKPKAAPTKKPATRSSRNVRGR